MTRTEYNQPPQPAPVRLALHFATSSFALALFKTHMKFVATRAQAGVVFASAVVLVGIRKHPLGRDKHARIGGAGYVRRVTVALRMRRDVITAAALGMHHHVRLSTC